MTSQQSNNKIDRFFDKYHKLFLVVSLVFAVIFGTLLFEMKMSIGEDDSAYILAAQKFIDGEAFPAWHGSFYPIFLSFFLKIFGLNILVFKLLSFVMIISTLFLTYYTFKNIISKTVLSLTILFSAVCLEILYFAGQTYSEALFMLIQISTIASFFYLYSKFITDEFSIKKHYVELILFGFFMFLLTLTRNIGWSLFVAVIVFLLLDKKIKQLFITLTSFLLFYIPFWFYKKIVWSTTDVGFEGQLQKMFWKNPYNVNDGYETFQSFISRIFENANIYLSKYFLMVIGWKESASTSTLISFTIIVLLITSFFILFKHKRELSFVMLYVLISIFATFVTQQVMWDQMRLIIIYVPLILLLFSSAVRILFIKNRISKFNILITILLLLVIIPSLIKTVKTSKNHIPILQANIKGDKFYGYTTDWQNFLKLTEWTSENIPPHSVIACRKPGLAYIYGGGRKFFGIYSINSLNISDAVNFISNKYKSNYVIEYQNQKDKINAIYPFFKNISTIITQDNGLLYVVYSMDDSLEYDFIDLISKTNISYIALEKLKPTISMDKVGDYAIYPDSLLENLRKNKVDYLLLSKIRKDPSDPNSVYINTLHMLAYFIETKYSGIFNIVWQIGNDNNEPSVLLKINYKKAMKY